MEESNHKNTDSAKPNEAADNERHYYYGRRRFWFPLIMLGLIIMLGLFFASAFGWHSRGFLAEQRTFVEGSGAMSTRRPFPGRGFSKNGIGRRTLGAVSSINGSTVTIKQNGQDVNITVISTTSIYKNGAIAKQADIKVGDVIIVRGAPGSDGSIQAKSIVIN